MERNDFSHLPEDSALNDKRFFIFRCSPGLCRIPRVATLAVAMVGLLGAIPAQAADECAAFPLENRISQLGGSRTSFAEGTQIDSVGTLQSEFLKYESDIRLVLERHGLSHVADALMDTVAEGRGIEQGSVEAGDDFEWMAWRLDGRAVTTVPVCLTTTRGYDAYEISVAVDNGDSITTYRFSIPNICMNIAYVGSETTARPVAMTPAPEPVAAAEPVPEPMAEPTRSGGFFGPFIGLEHRTRDLCNCIDDVNSGLVGLLGGVLIPTGREGTNLLMQVGGAANLREHEWSSLFADIGLDFDVGERGFVGAGIGLWDINESKMKDTNIYVHGGKEAWQWREHAVQWFAQGRMFLDRDDVEDIGTDYAILGGLRVMLNN